MKKILAVFLLLAGIAAAQTYGSFSGVVTGPTGIPVANASVTICHAGAVIIGTDCAQKATIYSSSTGGVLANPLTTNANGEFTFYAPPGDYTYSWSGNLYRASVTMAGNPVIAGLTIGSGPVMTAAPMVTWGTFVYSLHGPGAVHSDFVPQSAITITRMITASVAPVAGCTTYPQLSIQKNGTTVFTQTLSGADPYDSGQISIPISAGSVLHIEEANAAAGCTTALSEAQITVQYQMQ